MALLEKAIERKGNPSRHNLRDALSKLKRVVGESLKTNNKEVTVNLNVDIKEFRESIKKGNLSEASELYGGPFLEGIEGRLAETKFFMGANLNDWICDTRYKLAMEVYKVKIDLAEQEVSLGHVNAGVQLAEQAWAIYKEMKLEPYKLIHMHKILLSNNLFLAKEVHKEIEAECPEELVNFKVKTKSGEKESKKQPKEEVVINQPYLNPTHNFVGRQVEIIEIASKIQTSQLVTIFGPPGARQNRACSKNKCRNKKVKGFLKKMYILLG